MSSNAQYAAQFRQLHADGLLLLPNAWDAGSARLIESLGAKAIATTSAGVAWANGYADGDQCHRIQEANPIVLKNPDLIHPGLVLRIPKGQGKPLA